MDTIDHGILIPASPERVWQVISDINRLPQWHTDCRSVAFLTSLRSGPGTRWRMTSKRGQEYVLEITKWYDRLGYEYRYIDGVSFKTNQGLFRLQEVAEGTVVQWVFKFQASGLFSRASLGGKRGINSMMIDSLRSLYRYMKTPADGSERHEPKSLMRDAPDVEARSRYVPRHPSALETERGGLSTPDPFTAPAASGPRPAPQPGSALDRYLDPFYEPPVAEDDTRPRPAVIVPGSAPVPHPPTVTPFGLDEPDFIKDQPESAFARRPSETIRLDAPLEPAPSIAPASTQHDTVNLGDLPPLTAPSAPRTETVNLSREPLPSEPQAPAAKVTETLPESQRLSLDPDVDTSQISVFDLFGLPKPSETQEMHAVRAEASLPEHALVPDPTSPLRAQTATLPQVIAGMPGSASTAAGRVGLRTRQRRSAVPVRRPGVG